MSSKATQVIAPDSFRPRERLLLVLICVLAGVRVFIFNAAFPLFNNVDEQRHFDCVWRCAHGRLIAGLENFEAGTSQVIYRYETLEYLSDPAKDLTEPYPPTWLCTRQQAAQRGAFALATWTVRPNTEGVQPPVYYMIAGAWYRLGDILHFSLFWLRFMNVVVLMLTVWLSYIFAKNLYPSRTFLHLGLPLMIAVAPQDLFYSISNGVLFALLFGASFYCLMLICQHKRESLGFYVLAGILSAAALLTGYTNVPIYLLLGLTVTMRIVAARRSQTLGQEMPRLAGLLVAALVPVAVWVIRNYIVIGAPTAGQQFAEYANWLVKPFSNMWNHPIFTAGGLGLFWTELMTTYFRGEFVWHGQTLRNAFADAFYVWSPVVFLVSAAAAALITRTKQNRPERFVDGMGFLAILSSIAILVGLSIRYDFGEWFAPSSDHPYYSNGRLIYGTMLPLFALYLSGLDALLARLKAQKLRYPVLAAICVLMLVSEICISTGVFRSQFNWFHLIASGKRP